MEWAKNFTYFLLRVVSGLLFLQAGGMKMLGWFGGMPGANGAAPEAFTLEWFGGILELVGGTLVLLGLFTRPVAFVLSGQMAFAYWMFHGNQGGWPLENGGIPAVLFCFIFLYMAAEGGGPWSLDARFRRKKRRG